MSVQSPLSFHSGNTGSLTAATAEEILGSVGAISLEGTSRAEMEMNMCGLGHDRPAMLHSGEKFQYYTCELEPLFRSQCNDAAGLDGHHNHPCYHSYKTRSRSDISLTITAIPWILSRAVPINPKVQSIYIDSSTVWALLIYSRTCVCGSTPCVLQVTIPLHSCQDTTRGVFFPTDS